MKFQTLKYFTVPRSEILLNYVPFIMSTSKTGSLSLWLKQLYIIPEARFQVQVVKCVLAIKLLLDWLNKSLLDLLNCKIVLFSLRLK